jgi:hypothetical protein
MSVASDPGSIAPGLAEPAGGALRGRPRRRLVAGMAVALIAGAAAIALVVGDPFAGNPRPGVSDNASGTALARVTRGTLSSQTSVSGTLGYAGTYTIINERQGAFTALPHAGAIVGCGRVVYRVANARWCCCAAARPPTGRCRRGTAGRMCGS